MKKTHVSVADVRGYGRLAVDATIGLASLVETMHHNILRTPGILGESTQQPARGITGFVYKSIRGVTRLVGGGIDALLGRLVPLFDAGSSSPQREAVLAALNGVLGDHLAGAGNPLAIAMQWRRDGRALDLDDIAATVPQVSGKIVLLVHGLCMNDLQWQRNGLNYGTALAADAGYTPVYLHYNSGLHISTNGRALATQIEALLHAWPVPVRELTILTHSMGGLVARSACHHAGVENHAWLQQLRALMFLGTPHQGAPLERGGNWVDVLLDASPYTTAFARLGKIRSAGITDLRHGNLLDTDWAQHDRFARRQRVPQHVPLPRGVACFAIAASIANNTLAKKTLAKKTDPAAKHLPGDGLVPLASALGQHATARRRLEFAPDRQWVGYGMNHMDLLGHEAVYARIRQWLDA